MAHQFKVGDRVRLTNSAFADTWGLRGVLTIREILGASRAYFQESTYCAGLHDLELAPALIDPAKKYQTRDGREVRIYATDGGGEEPIHGAIQEGGAWTGVTWLADGRYYGDRDDLNDLIEVKPEREYWVNVYSADFPACLYPSKQDADAGAGSDRIACVHLKFREGDGL